MISPKNPLLDYFDASWYSSTSKEFDGGPDKAFDHYIDSGEKMGFWPNPFFFPEWFLKQYMREIQGVGPLEYYVSEISNRELAPNPLVELDYLAREYSSYLEHKDPLGFMIQHAEETNDFSSYFSRSFYLREYPDVKSVLPFPEFHWLNYGIKENRRISDSLICVKEADIVDDFCRRKYSLSLPMMGEYWICESGVPETIAEQVIAQTQFEPDLMSVGPKAFRNLRQFDAHNLYVRDLVDYEELTSQFTHADAVIILPRLGIGGAEKYASSLSAALQSLGSKITILTTESDGDSDRANLRYDISRGFRGCNLISLRDILKRTWRGPNILALILLSIRPKNIFVVNSQLGIETMIDYGRGLSKVADIYTFFFSQSPITKGVSFPAKYLRDLIHHSHIVSDNQVALERFDRDTSGLFDKRLILLPQPVSMQSDDKWRSLTRHRSTQAVGEKISILWCSRWCIEKCTELIYLLAKREPNFIFHIYGASDSQLDDESGLENIFFHGQYQSLNEVPVAKYDVFLFTSFFEGMPNILLEMAGLAIPIVASDVGGIKETFSENEIQLVNMEQSLDDVASSFSNCIYKSVNESAQDMTRRLDATRAAVVSRHSMDNFKLMLKALIS